MTLCRASTICCILIMSVCLGCHNRVDEVYYLPDAMRFNEDIYLGQSIRYLEREGLLQYDEYCDCYFHEQIDAEAPLTLHINQYTKGKIVKTLLLEYGRDIDYRQNEKMAHELIDTLIREYGENYLIVDASTLSFEGHKRPKLFWRTDEGVDVTLAFMPHGLFDIIKTEQVLVLTQIDVEFSLAEKIDVNALVESTQWTRESLGLK